VSSEYEHRETVPTGGGVEKYEFFFVAEFWSAAPIIDFVTIQAS